MSNYPFPNQPLWIRPIQMVYLWGYNLYHKIRNKIRGYDGTHTILLFKPQANHNSFLDGTEFCGNCGKIKKYGHRTAFRTSLDCKCKS